MEEKRAIAEIGYSKKYGQLELTLPHGTKTADYRRISAKIWANIEEFMPRGCQACLSGESLLVRERLENVLRIDLESMEVIGRG